MVYTESNEVGERLRLAVHLSGSSQKSLAQQLGIAEGSISNYVTVHRAIPMMVARRSAVALAVDLHWLLTGCIGEESREIAKRCLATKLSVASLAATAKVPVSLLAAVVNGEIGLSADVSAAILMAIPAATNGAEAHADAPGDAQPSMARLQPILLQIVCILREQCQLSVQMIEDLECLVAPIRHRAQSRGFFRRLFCHQTQKRNKEAA